MFLLCFKFRFISFVNQKEHIVPDPLCSVDTIYGSVACCPVGGEYINGAVVGRLRMECVLHDTSISYAFVIHLLLCSTKFYCFVGIGIIVAAARGKGESSKHRKGKSPNLHCFHFVFIFVCLCFCQYKRCEAGNPAS